MPSANTTRGSNLRQPSNQCHPPSTPPKKKETLQFVAKVLITGLLQIHFKNRGHSPLINHRKQGISVKKKVKKVLIINILLNEVPYVSLLAVLSSYSYVSMSQPSNVSCSQEWIHGTTNTNLHLTLVSTICFILGWLLIVFGPKMKQQIAGKNYVIICTHHPPLLC